MPRRPTSIKGHLPDIVAIRAALDYGRNAAQNYGADRPPLFEKADRALDRLIATIAVALER